MLPRIALVLLVAAGGCGMNTRETVERTVVVRTTGSDLQPAATGYVYKKKNDGEESVVEMGESEIMKRLSQFYEHPKEFAGLERAPGERRSEAADASGERRVIPVTEKDEERADGLADEDYEKIFDDYTPTYDNDGYRDYLESLKRFRGGLYHGYDGGSAEDGTGYGSGHRGDLGLYHKRRFESLSATGGHDTGHRDDEHYRAHHDRDHHEVDPKTYHDEETGSGFHKIYDNKKDDNDHKYFGRKVKAFPDARKYYGTRDTEHKYDGPREPHHDDGSSGGDHAAGGGRAEGQGFGFAVQH